MECSLSFPVNITGYIKDEFEFSVEGSYSALESFKSKLVPLSERTHNGNIHCFCVVNAQALSRMIGKRRVQKVIREVY